MNFSLKVSFLQISLTFQVALFQGRRKKRNPTNPENFEDSQDFSGKASLTNCLALVTFGHEADGTFHFGSLCIFLV